jgi:hypothetical protein
MTLEERVEQLEKKHNEKANISYQNGLLVGFKFGINCFYQEITNLFKELSNMSDENTKNEIDKIIKESKERREAKNNNG